MPSKVILRNGRERAEYGCVTIWKNAAGETMQVYRGGSPREALITTARDVLSRDDTFRLLVYSTPETIYRDLAMADARQNPLARTPESAALAQVGLHHLLHPDAPTNIETHLREKKAHGYWKRGDGAA